MKVKELIQKNVDNIDGQLIGNFMTAVMDDALVILEQRIASNIGAVALEELNGVSNNDELLEAELDEEKCNEINDNLKKVIEPMFRMATFFALIPRKSFINYIELLKSIIDEQVTIKKIGLANDEETLLMICNMREVINFNQFFKDDIDRLELNDIEQLVILADSLSVVEDHRAIIDNNDFSELYENIAKTIKAYEQIRTIRSLMEVMSNE